MSRCRGIAHLETSQIAEGSFAVQASLRVHNAEWQDPAVQYAASHSALDETRSPRVIESGKCSRYEGELNVSHSLNFMSNASYEFD